MSRVLFVTSSDEMFKSCIQDLKLKKLEEFLYLGKLDKRDIGILLVENTKVDSTILLTISLLTSLKDEVSKIIVINPVQCPDVNVSLGQLILASSISEWDKNTTETKVLSLLVPELGNKVIVGLGFSGDRLCVNKTTPILKSKMIDFITFPISKVSKYLGLPVLSIGIVVDYCTPNFIRLLQSNIKELSSRMIDFLKSNSSILLGE